MTGYDAFSSMEARRASGSQASNAAMGRGATAGWVKCPLCSARRQKRFARGRGLQMHLDVAHGDASAEAKAAAVVAAEDAAARSSERTGGGSGSSWSAGEAARRAVPAACALARDGDVASLEALVERGAFEALDVAHRDAHGYRPHHWAAGTRGGCLEWLLDLRPAAAVDAATRRERRDGKRGSRTVLHWACRNGVDEHVELLLRRSSESQGGGAATTASSSPDAASADGTTPLMLALYKGSLRSCDLLRGAGASVLVRENDWRCTDAHWAAMGDAPVAALEWLKGEVDPDRWRRALSERQAQGHSVFHKAAQRGRGDALRWLLREATAARADVRRALAPDASGRSPAQIAKASGFPDAALDLEAVEVDRGGDRGGRARRVRRLAAAAACLAALALVARRRLS